MQQQKIQLKMTLNITQLQLKEKIRMYLLPFKSKDFQKTFSEYRWLFISIGIAYLCGTIVGDGYMQAMKYIGVDNDFQEKALFSISSTAIFCLIFLKKDLAQIFLMLNLGMLAAIEFSLQIYAVLTFSQLLVMEYLMMHLGTVLVLELNRVRGKTLTWHVFPDLFLFVVLPPMSFYFLIFCC